MSVQNILQFWDIPKLKAIPKLQLGPGPGYSTLSQFSNSLLPNLWKRSHYIKYNILIEQSPEM